jgi:hypothetical protein
LLKEISRQITGEKYSQSGVAAANAIADMLYSAPVRLPRTRAGSDFQRTAPYLDQIA